jgi:hypothetical protein
MSDRSAHVRFRDGDGLVEYEGSPANPSSDIPKKEKKRTDKPLPTRSASISGAIGTGSGSSGAKKVSKKRIESKDESCTASEIAAPVTGPNGEQPSPAVKEPPSVDGTPERPGDEHKLKFFSAFQVRQIDYYFYAAFKSPDDHAVAAQTINRVHGGAVMKIKTGTAGVTPDKDSFPMFGSVKRWTCLHWDAETVPARWCIAWYDDTPEWFTMSLQEVAKGGGESNNQADDAANVCSSGSSSPVRTPPGPTLVQSSLFPLPTERLAVKAIRICDISDIYLESLPSTGFRVYCGREVVHFTPLTSYNLLSRRPACWADSLYSMMALQGESDPELVLLYKQEFMQLLQQAENDRLHQQQQQQASEAASPQRSRPVLLRRRSTLSSLLGIAPSKQLEADDVSDWRASEAAPEGSPGSSLGVAKPQKMSLKGAVKLIQRKLSLGSMSAKGVGSSTPVSRNSAADRAESEGRPPVGYGGFDGNHRDGEGGEPADAAAASDNEAKAGNSDRERRPASLQRGNSAGPAFQSNYLTQSVLGTVRQQHSPSRGTDASHPSAPFAITARTSGKTGTVEQLQAQIDALLEHNRALHEKLHSTGRGPEEYPPPLGADSFAAAAGERKPTPPPVIYSAQELSTLRNFTARSNFHSNQTGLVNSKRAFSQAGLHSAADLAAVDKEAWLAKHGHSRGRSPSPSARARTHVLGKQSVLDTLLSRNIAAAPQHSSPGDDYYNDTIELDPHQVEQLVELHKLQQLSLAAEGKRDQAVNTDPESAELSQDLAPVPVTERRRRDSTAEIPLWRLSVSSASSGTEVRQPVTGLFGNELTVTGASGGRPRLSSAASTVTVSSVCGADPTEDRVTPSTAKYSSETTASPARPDLSSPASHFTHAGRGYKSPSPGLAKGPSSLGAGLSESHSAHKPSNSTQQTHSAVQILTGSSSSSHHSPQTAPHSVVSNSPTVQRPGPVKQSTSHQGRIKTFTANEKQVIVSHDREVKLLNMLKGDAGKVPTASAESVSGSRSRSSTGVSEEKQHSEHSSAGTRPVVATPPRTNRVAKVGAGVLQAVSGGSYQSPPQNPKASASDRAQGSPGRLAPPASVKAPTTDPLFPSDDEYMSPPEPRLHQSAPKWSNQYRPELSDHDAVPATEAREGRRRRRAKHPGSAGGSVSSESPSVPPQPPGTSEKRVADAPPPTLQVAIVSTGSTANAVPSGPLELVLATSALHAADILRSRGAVYAASGTTSIEPVQSLTQDTVPARACLVFCGATEAVFVPLTGILPYCCAASPNYTEMPSVALLCCRYHRC